MGALQTLLKYDTQGSAIINFIIHHGIGTWHFYPPFAISCLFPQLQFVKQEEWDIFNPYASPVRRAKKSSEAISFLEKVQHNCSMKPQPEYSTGLQIDSKNDWTFRDLCGYVWRYVPLYSVLGHPETVKLANIVTKNQFQTWVQIGTHLTGYEEPYFGWRHLANLLYTFNLVNCHTQFVVQHVLREWGPKIVAADRAELKKTFYSIKKRRRNEIELLQQQEDEDSSENLKKHSKRSKK